MTTSTTTKNPIRLRFETSTDYITLANPCRRCDGDGYLWVMVNAEEAERDDLCPTCEGTGYALTSAGQSIVALAQMFHRSHDDLAYYDLPFD